MNRIAAAIAIIAVLVLVGFGVWSLQNSPRSYAGEVESIVIGTSPVEGSSLIYIAEDQGYFAENGLNVTIQFYDTGRDNVDGMKKGKTDISVSSEYPIVTETFKKENISVIGSIDKFQTQYLLGRKDHGIENISDLKGKRIGVSLGTIREFYLGRFLSLHGISLQDVTLVDVPTSQSSDAVIDGSVDAIIYYPPYVNAIRDQMGDNVIIWPAQNSQLTYQIMACQDEWAASHPSQINRLLKSLDQAEEYTINHPDEAKAIVQKRLNFTDAYMATIGPEHQFSLSLDQSLVLAMEDEGRWMIKNNLTTEKTIPDFRDYFYTEGIEIVKPGAVNIIE